MSTTPTTQHRAPQITKGDGSMVRVLVVDDEHSLTELLKMALRYEGWDVRTAADGFSAVKVAREFRPDAIVLDIMLPDIDGLEVLQRVRADGTETPVLFLTAKDSLDDRIAASPRAATTTSPSRSASRRSSRACADSSAARR